MEIGLDWKCGGKVNKRQKRNQVTCLKKKREEAPAFLNGGGRDPKMGHAAVLCGLHDKEKKCGFQRLHQVEKRCFKQCSHQPYFSGQH